MNTNALFYAAVVTLCTVLTTGAPADGRSSFGTHAFSSRSSNIYDAVMQVDSDSNPDHDTNPDGCVAAWLFDLSWTGYTGAVVDYNPPSTPTAPVSYTFELE
jgi:hypothetical protein